MDLPRRKCLGENRLRIENGPSGDLRLHRPLGPFHIVVNESSLEVLENQTAKLRFQVILFLVAWRRRRNLWSWDRIHFR